MEELWHICYMEYYLVIRKNEIPPLASWGSQLENIMFCEIGRSPMDKYHIWYKAIFMQNTYIDI